MHIRNDGDFEIFKAKNINTIYVGVSDLSNVISPQDATVTEENKAAKSLEVIDLIVSTDQSVVSNVFGQISDAVASARNGETEDMLDSICNKRKRCDQASVSEIPAQNTCATQTAQCDNVASVSVQTNHPCNIANPIAIAFTELKLSSAEDDKQSLLPEKECDAASSNNIDVGKKIAEVFDIESDSSDDEGISLATNKPLNQQTENDAIVVVNAHKNGMFNFLKCF